MKFSIVGFVGFHSKKPHHLLPAVFTSGSTASSSSHHPPEIPFLSGLKSAVERDNESFDITFAVPHLCSCGPSALALKFLSVVVVVLVCQFEISWGLFIFNMCVHRGMFSFLMV